MAVTNFIQTIWSKKIQDDLEIECKLVQNCHRAYEGDVKYAKSVKLYMTAQVLEGTGLNPGYYEFGADGKMDVSVKNGVIDGFLYINDVKQTAYTLVEFEGAYYFIQISLLNIA